ncbi:MAG: hypothetical protein C0445_10515 [Polaromonas sp.]|nr:hypothetical protein [Polaromonas sp.]
MATLSCASNRGPVLDFVQRHLTHALRDRVRYRYVQPMVWQEGGGYRIESPCCSRNVDPQGGLIDIAWLLPADSDAAQALLPQLSEADGWVLCARDHRAHAWLPRHTSRHLNPLLELLCVDSDRVFWP